MITKTIKITVAAILTAALIVSGSILIPYTGDVAIAADEYSADLTGQQYSADMKNGLGIEGWNRKNAKDEPLPKVSTKGKAGGQAGRDQLFCRR